MTRIKTTVANVQAGDCFCGTGRVVARVEHRGARKRTDRPIRSAGAGRVKARTTIVFEDGTRWSRDPDEVTFVER